MAENTDPGANGGQGANNGQSNSGNANGSQGQTNANGSGNGGSNSFDVASLSDEQITKVLEDPRLFKTKRIADLMDKSKKLDLILEQQKRDHEASLEKDKKHQELAELRAQERDTWKNKATEGKIDNAIIIEAAKQGVSDIDAALKLLDRSAIKVSDAGDISGVADAIANLLKDKPYLKSKIMRPMGGGTNPSDGGNGQEFTMTQIQDPVFYQKNEKEIRAAIAAGKVKEDRF